MSIRLRNYNYPEDYYRVSDFLIAHHQPGNKDGNWLEPEWEYMHFHPMLDESNLNRIAIWETEEEIVAVCNYELRLGEAYFQIRPDYHFLKEEMLDETEKRFTAISRKGGRRYLGAYINDYDHDFLNLAKKRGYEKEAQNDRPTTRFDISEDFPSITLPQGFRLTSLADECDWAKVHRVIWRGFNHEGEPPPGEEELESRRKMFDTPKARRDLKIAVVAPNGDFVAFCGMFYEANARFGYVEPVATDPDYRRMGLGKAAVLEGIRRCGELGARVAYVGSTQPFYLSIGFKLVYNTECWVKRW